MQSRFQKYVRGLESTIYIQYEARLMVTLFLKNKDIEGSCFSPSLGSKDKSGHVLSAA